MKNVNSTYETISTFQQYSIPFGNLYYYIRNIESYDNQAKILTQLLSSEFYQDFIESDISDKYDFNFQQMKNKNVTELTDSLKENTKYFKMVNKFTKAIECIETNRIQPVDGEEDMIEAAESGRLLAGITFLDSEAKNLTTSEKHIQYKIRMDVDKVPDSSKLKERLWVPGPDADMYYNMRYFWGFIQIQDMIDNAIMKLHNVQDSVGIFLQQSPYPCFRRDNYNSGLYTTQIIQVALVFGFSLVVGLSVREFIWERESQNLQLMRIMGVKYSAILTSAFFYLFIIVLFNSILLTVILHFGQMMQHSNPFIIFLVLLTFGLAIITFIFLLSLFLQKSSSGSVSAFLIFIVTFLPFIIIIALEEQISTVWIVLSNLCLTTSFGFSFLYMTRYEQRGEGIHWENYMETPLEDDEMSCFYCHLLLLLDSIIYSIIAFLIAKYASINGTLSLKRNDKKSYAESNMEKGIHLVGLYKVYKIDRKHRRVAVDLENLSFKENEITGLLGHNGAGKSTTMAMITGMEIPTAGTICINNDALDSEIGYCPQHSILYENLTVREHLEFFASMKTNNKDADKEVENMMRSMRILDKADTLSKNLSEGLKRRLSVGIAFIGDSKVVILDEPTSGVDPNARQDIWNLITSYKKNRTIVVSTHYIDEAELLCDKIVIMHKGRKLEEGTGLELQSKFGNDLRLEIVTDVDINTEITSLNSSETSSSINSPMPPLNDNIDKHITTLCPVVKPHSATHKKRTYKLPSQQPDHISLYQKLFAVLENEKDILNIKTFTLYSPSLEEIFIEMIDKENIENIIFNRDKQKHKVVPINEDLSDISINSQSQWGNSSLVSLREKEQVKSEFSIFFVQIFALILKRFWNFMGDKKVFLMTLVLPILLLILAMITAKIRPKTETPVLLLTPSMYGPQSVSFSSFEDLSQNDIVNSLFKPPGIGTSCMKNTTFASTFTHCNMNKAASNFSVSANDKSCSCSSQYTWKCQGSSTSPKISLTKENTTDDVYHLEDKIHPNQWILNSHHEFLERRYGGWRLGIKSPPGDKIGLTKQNAVVYYNNKGRILKVE